MLIARRRITTPASFTQFPEWLFAGMITLVGTWLALPGTTLDQPNYVYMRAFASEGVWATILLAVGGFRLVILLCSRRRADVLWTLHARAMISFPSAFFWSKMGFQIHRANPGAILPLLCFSVALADVAILYLVAFQAGLMDQERASGRR